MADTLKTMEEVRRVNAALPFTDKSRESGRCHAPSIKAWKEQGKKVIAFQCTYVPEEVIYAAGMMSVRLVGGETRELELEDANAWLYINTCSFIRSCAQLVLGKHYDFLDGFVAAATCDPTRRLADIWKHCQFTPFIHVMDVPRKFTERAHERYRVEVLGLKRALEEFFKVNISDEDLWDAVGVFNRTRELFAKLYELKKLDNPPITGAETQEIYNAMYKMPREEFNRLLERLVDEARSGNRAIEAKLRLLISGSPLNNPEFIKTIEDLGALVVVDEFCTGSRYWWDLVDTSTWADPLEAICRRYLNNQPCARMMPSEDRTRRVMEMVDNYRVDGVISEIVRYCVPYAHDQPFLRETLENRGIPVLELDVEYGIPGTGQIRTRAQAFLEMLEGKMQKRESRA
ncbi:MAG: 2-hydroxyacyl-CoA dehydratase family protein [Pseudomonadota bacterium]